MWSCTLGSTIAGLPVWRSYYNRNLHPIKLYRTSSRHVAIQRNHPFCSLLAMRQLAKEPECLLKPPKTNHRSSGGKQKTTTEADSGGAWLLKSPEKLCVKMLANLRYERIPCASRFSGLTRHLIPVSDGQFSKNRVFGNFHRTHKTVYRCMSHPGFSSWRTNARVNFAADYV